MFSNKNCKDTFGVEYIMTTSLGGLCPIYGMLGIYGLKSVHITHMPTALARLCPI